MTGRYCNPAIFAGLTGAALVAQPQAAHALSAFGYELPTNDPTFTFVAGCVVGALVASATTVAVSAVMMKPYNSAGSKDAQPRQARVGGGAAEASQASSAPVFSSEGTAVQRPQTNQNPVSMPADEALSFDLGISAPNPYAADRDTSAATETSGALRGNPAIATSVVFAGSSTPSSTDGASHDYADVAQEYVRSRTFAERMATRARGVATVLSERLGANKLEGLPVIERADGTVGDVGEAWWDTTFANQRVNDDFVTRLAATPEAHDPFALYQKRNLPLSSEKGFNQPQARSQANPYGMQTNIQAKAQPEPECFGNTAGQMAHNPQVVDVPCAAADSSVTARHGSIAARVADPSETFPEEPRWTDAQQDLWAVALEALDARFEEEVALGPDAMAPAFDDDLGGQDSLDEPEGLESSTVFMSFKPQANHPEVTDTGSYIELLVNQELSHAKNESVRKSFRDYLRVIDGGTSSLKGRGDKTTRIKARPQRDGEVSPRPHGKHFAPPKDSPDDVAFEA